MQICTYQSRTQKLGQNKNVSWSEFRDYISKPARTFETYSQFIGFTKARQHEIKDVGGFVGGYVKDGRRGKAYIQSRSMVALDADNAVPENFLQTVSEALDGFAYAVYPTHKSKPGKRRYRVCIPLSRDVTPDEYEPVARAFAHRLGIDVFDVTTYQPERLMFYPSISSDSEWDYIDSDGPFWDPDWNLDEYKDWRDVTCWYRSDAEPLLYERDLTKAKQQDPLSKNGVIGAFCRAYPVSKVLTDILPDVYKPTDEENRYTYSSGTTSAGMIVYEDKFVYSHHATDPVGGQLVNAFDLVRIHKYGDLDADARAGTTGDNLPSFKAMKEFAAGLPAVKSQLVSTRVSAFEDFSEELKGDSGAPADPADTDDSWIEKLDINKKTGEILTTVKNIKLVLENDSGLKNHAGLDLMAHRPVKLARMPWDNRSLPFDKIWSDTDDAALRNYLEEKYGLHGKDRISDVLMETLSKHAFHPVRDYLNGLTWDGVERLDTLVVDYLGASDSEYTRAVTRKAFTACCARVFEPGCKYDYVLLLIGRQGKGKSKFLDIMGGEWYSDTITDIGGKKAYEALDGSWIMEMAEMTAAKRAEIEALKQYISKRSDKYRKAYDRRVTENPRQCVFFGTTNEPECLRDYTGNRRFWVLEVRDGDCKKDIEKDLRAERDQVWAEAMTRYKAGERLYLDEKLEKLAEQEQRFHTFESTRWSDIRYYLDRKVPENWSEMDLNERMSWLENHDDDEGEVLRDVVCTKEIWVECCGGSPRNFGTIEQRDISACLQHLGWERQKTQTRDKLYGLQRRYARTRGKLD